MYVERKMNLCTPFRKQRFVKQEILRSRICCAKNKREKCYINEQAKLEYDWMVMSSVSVASQSSFCFLCSRELIRLANLTKIFLPLLPIQTTIVILRPYKELYSVISNCIA